MTMAELILALAYTNQHDDLMGLNEGGFPTDAGAILVFGVSTELFFNSEGDPARKAAAVTMAERHYADCGGSPNQIVQESDARALASADDIRRVLGLSRTDDPTTGDLAAQMTDRRETLSFYMRHAPPADTRVPSHDKFACLVDGEGYRGGGSFIAYDRRIAAVTNDPDGFVRAFVERCGAVGAFYAVSGLALLFATYASRAPSQAYPLFQRFPGLLYADAGTFSAEIKRRADVILDVNWLTAIDDAMFARLGGEAAAAAALGPEVVRHPFDGGVVFQAGGLPRYGDRNAGDIPAAYRQVARFLKPLRFDGWTRPYLLRVPDGVDREEATAEWLRRFD